MAIFETTIGDTPIFDFHDYGRKVLPPLKLNSIANCNWLRNTTYPPVRIWKLNHEEAKKKTARHLPCTNVIVGFCSGN